MAANYFERRSEIEAYFDRTALAAWERLTSDKPVSRVRATVRAGRDEMRATLLSYLPHDLRGARVLDAGCGTGAFAAELARRGAEVVAVDLSPQLIDIARDRVPADVRRLIRFEAGDMLDARLGSFDHIVAMDSLIHYSLQDMVSIVGELAARCHVSMAFTYAPRTRALAAMHFAGRLFPRSNRAPAIEPVSTEALTEAIRSAKPLACWRTGRDRRIASGFYISQAQELVRR
jgi:magnesium-protoporphyrin O-methyltransferase